MVSKIAINLCNWVDEKSRQAHIKSDDGREEKMTLVQSAFVNQINLEGHRNDSHSIDFSITWISIKATKKECRHDFRGRHRFAPFQLTTFIPRIF